MPGNPRSDRTFFCLHLYLAEKYYKNSNVPVTQLKVNPSRTITWLVGVTRRVASGGAGGAMPPPDFRFCSPSPIYFLPPPRYFLGRNKLLFLAGKNVKICDFGQKKPSDFGEDLFFGDHLIFTKTSPQSNSGIMKKLCPPDFNFAPRSREAGDAPGCNHVL